MYVCILAQNNGFPGIPTAPNQLVTVTLMRCPAVEGQRLHERREAQQHANARVDIVPSIHTADPLGSYVIWVPVWTHRIWNYALWEMCNGELKHQNKWCWWFPWWLCPINRFMTKNVSGKPMVHKQNLKWSLTPRNIDGHRKWDRQPTISKGFLILVFKSCNRIYA